MAEPALGFFVHAGYAELDDMIHSFLNRADIFEEAKVALDEAAIPSITHLHHLPPIICDGSVSVQSTFVMSS